MKNLKKVLSLVLALAMALSLMTVAFAKDASDYADYSKVTYNEAVDVMTAIGVFDGMDGTNFAPNGTLTREQAAKIITYMLMGKDNADKLTTTIAPYSDVAANRWSAGAIAYCTNAGILSGVGHGKFNPTEQLTGLQFSKMLLVALGYNAERENLVGESWSINAATLGIAAGLTSGMAGVQLNGYLTREQAAQMAFNAEKAIMVEYGSKTEVTTGDSTVVISGSRDEMEWIIGGASNDGNIKNDGYVQFAEKYCSDLMGVSDSDAFYNPATTWNFKGADIGTYVEKADLSYTSTVNYKDLKKALPSAVVTNVNNTYSYYVDGTSTAFSATDLRNGTDLDIATTGNGVLTQVHYDYVPAAGSTPAHYNVIITSTNTYATKVVISEKNDDGKYDVDTTSPYDFESTTSFAENTIVLYTWSAKTNAVESMKAAKSITGNTTAVKTNNAGTVGESFTMNGTTYEYNLKFDVNDAGEQPKLTENAENVVAYVDDYGYVIRIDNAETESKYAVVLGYSNGWAGTTSTRQVQLLLADGTVKNVDMKNKTAAGASITWGTTIAVGDIITYTVDSSNVYTATATTPAVANGEDGSVPGNNKALKVTSGKSEIVVDGNTYYATNKTVFFLYNGDSYSAYVGINNVPSLETTNALDGYYVVATSGTAQAVYMITDKNVETGVAGEKAAFIYKTGAEKYYDVKDVDTYYTVNAVVDGKATTLDVKSSYYGSLSTGANLVSKMSIDKNNLVTNTAAIAVAEAVDAASYTAAKDGMLKIGTSGYTYTTDAIAFVYDISDKAFTQRSVTSLRSSSANADFSHVYAQLNDNGVVVAIYYVQA